LGFISETRQGDFVGIESSKNIAFTGVFTGYRADFLIITSIPAAIMPVISPASGSQINVSETIPALNDGRHVAADIKGGYL
jgi:hypothetical protein